MNTDQEVKLTRSSPTKKQRDASKRQLAKMVKDAEQNSINEFLGYKPGKPYPVIANHKAINYSFDWLQINIRVTEKQYNNIERKAKKLNNRKWKTGGKPSRRMFVEGHQHIDYVCSVPRSEAKDKGYLFGYKIMVEDAGSPIRLYFNRQNYTEGVKYSIGIRMNPSHHCISSIDNAVKALEGIHSKFIALIYKGIVTRIDFAVDIFNMNVRNFFYEPKSLQRCWLYLNRHREIETMGYGKRTNGLLTYDKAAEIKKKRNKDGGREFGTHGKRTLPLGDLTRVELRKQLKIPLSSLIGENYWPDISTLKCYEARKVNYPDQFFMPYSRVVGLHVAMGMLLPDQKRVVRTLLKEAQISLPINNENHECFKQACLIVRYLVGSDAERQAIKKEHLGDKSKYIHCGLLTKQLKKFSTDFTGKFNKAQLTYLEEIVPNYAEIKRQSKAKKKSEFPIGLPITREEAIRLITLGHLK